MGKPTRGKRKRSLIGKTVILVVLLAVLGVAVFFLIRTLQKDAEKVKDQEQTNQEQTQGDPAEGEAGDQELQEGQEAAQDTSSGAATDRQTVLDEAAYLAATYDYDGAMEKLNSLPGAAQDPEISAKLTEYQTAKDSCVPVNPEQVTHIFYHSLVVDPERGFAGDDSIAAGFKQWMTTMDEFNKITQTMYDNGYVMVRLRDLVVQTTDADGTVHFTPNTNLMLPPGKKAYVLSLDDLSYYHSYDGRGIASKMVLDENGKPVCEYIQADGTTVTGAYDCVPLLDQFIEEHPDASYHGAKGMIALTGYNGILGYRTDIAYKTGENLSADQQAWLDAHPDFNWEQECQEAKKVADAIKEQGWEFASHTWGHMHVGDASMERLQADTEKWENYVKPLVGETDTIIFAHGQDLDGWQGYAADNEKFNYLKSKGFNFFCNVDGYRLWYDVHGESNKTSDLFDASQILDPRRTDVPPL